MRLLAFAILFISAFLFTSAVFAFEVPKDAVIKVYDSSGKEIGSMSRSAYKVVKIEDESKAQVKKESKSHLSVIYHVGGGVAGYKVNNSGLNFRISERIEPVVGATLCYGDNVAACATALSNRTFTLGIKHEIK